MLSAIQDLIGVGEELTYEILTTKMDHGGLGFQPLDIQYRTGQTMRIIAAVEQFGGDTVRKFLSAEVEGVLGIYKNDGGGGKTGPVGDVELSLQNHCVKLSFAANRKVDAETQVRVTCLSGT